MEFISYHSNLNDNTIRLALRKLSEGEKLPKGIDHDYHLIIWKKKLEDVQVELQKLKLMVRKNTDQRYCK